MKRRLGRTFLTIVRPLDVLRKILQSNPYAGFRLAPGSQAGGDLLHEKPESRISLPVGAGGACILSAKGGEVFSAYVPGPRGPVFMTLIESTFGASVTTRTWETLERVTA